MNKRRIKKYTNRRLYDTVDSRYVTLDDIRKLIVSGIDVEIVDEAKQVDITRSLLLQIVSDLEFSGQSILNEQFLAQLIRFYGHPMQGFMSDYLSKSLDGFVNQQKDLQSQFKKAISVNHIETMQDLTKKNIDMWQSFQKSFFHSSSEDDDKTE